MDYKEVLCKMPDILGHPFVISLFSLLVGSWLINRINYKKQTRDLKQTEAVRLANEISERINAPLSLIYAYIRRGECIDCDEFSNELRYAYTFRLRMRVASQFYFSNREIAIHYDEIIRELRKIRDFVRHKGSSSEDELIKKAEVAREELLKKWGIEVVSKNFEQIGLNKAILNWSDVIWKYADDYLMRILNKINYL